MEKIVVKSPLGIGVFVSLPGPVIILGYAFFFALSMVFLKMLYDKDFSVGQANTLSSIFQVTFSFVFFNFAHGNAFFVDFQNVVSYLLLMFFIAATIFRQTAIDFADAGNCSSFLALVPLTTAPLAFFLINDRVDYKVYSATCVCCLIGVMLVIQPAFLFANNTIDVVAELPGYILMFVSVISYSSFLVYQRMQHVDEYFITFWSSLGFLCVYGTMWAIEADWTSLSLFNTLLIISHAFFRVCSGITLALGSSKTSPTLTGILIMLEVPFTYILEFLLIGTELNFLTYVGVAILVVSSIFYKYFTNSHDHHEQPYTAIPDQDASDDKDDIFAA